MAAICIVLLLQSGEWSTSKPPALLAMEAARAGWSQIEVHWDYQLASSPRKMHCYNRYGEGEWIGTELGDDEGYGPQNYDTNELMRIFPTHMLFKANGAIWRHEEHAPSAALWGPTAVVSAIDLRNVGLEAHVGAMRRWSDYVSRIWKPNVPVTYRQYDSGDGTVTVEARSDAPNTSVQRWILAKNMDYQPVRVELVHAREGSPKRYAEIKYQPLADGTYFVSAADFYSEDGERCASIQVTDVRSGADLPKTFTPEDIGVDDGTHLDVVMYAVPPTKYPGFPLVYCQGEIIDVWDMGDRIRAGEATLGKNVAEFQEKAFMGLNWRDPFPESRTRAAGVAGELTLEDVREYLNAPASDGKTGAARLKGRTLTEWERYTLDFIRANQLNDEQIQKAILILRDCEARKKALETLLKINSTKCREQCDKLFEERLKPRLERLLTRKQLEVAQAKGG